MPSQRCVSIQLVFYSFSCINNVFKHDVLSPHLLFLFYLLQEQGAKPAPEPSSTQADPVPVAPAEPPAEPADETWEEKEDKQSAEPDRPKATPEPTEQKYQYKEGKLWLRFSRSDRVLSFCM